MREVTSGEIAHDDLNPPRLDGKELKEETNKTTGPEYFLSTRKCCLSKNAIFPSPIKI